MNWESLKYTANIQKGPLLSEAVFNYVRITDSFDSLAEKAGFIWYIDYDKTMHFVERSTYAAPFVLTRSKFLKDSLVIEQGNPSYRNRQYIKGGKDITDPITENKKGDGEARSWVVSFPIAKEPVISVNGTQLLPGEIGIRGVEKDKKYYWSKGDNTLSQDDKEAVLTAANTLSITYQGEFDIVVLSDNQDGIDSKRTIEGGTGLVEVVDDDPTIDSSQAGFELANARLKKYSVNSKKIKFTTLENGLAAGQLLTVNLPEYGLNNEELLIDSVVIRYENSTYFYDVQAVFGPSSGSWAKMFYAMATKGQTFIIRQNISEKQVLVTLSQFSKTWEATDSFNIFKEVYASDTLMPSETLFPTFAPSDRVKYVELVDESGQVLLRKNVTKQTSIDNILNSIIYIAPFEANGQIEMVNFYGGIVADDIAGNGVIVESVPYSKLKSQLEAVQIDRTDTRNFTPDIGTLLLSSAYWTSIDDAVNEFLENSQ